MRSKKKGALHKFSFSMLICLGFFFLLEGFLEIIDVPLLSQSLVYQDTVTTWRLQSNLKNKRIRTPHDSHDFVVSTNQDGLRTSLNPKKEHIDIAFLGDSNMFGWGLDDADTFSERLQDIFPQYNFLNGGQPGHSTVQSYELFMETMPKYRPRWTILLLSMHDHNQAPLSDLERKGVVHGITPHIRIWLQHHLRVYGLIRQKVIPERKNPADTQGETYRVRDDERELLLAKMIKKADNWNGKIALALFPFHEDLIGESFHRPCVSWSKKMTLKYQIPILNLSSCCRDPDKDLTFSFDRGHLNAKGITTVLPHLQKELFLQKIIPSP